MSNDFVTGIFRSYLIYSRKLLKIYDKKKCYIQRSLSDFFLSMKSSSSNSYNIHNLHFKAYDKAYKIYFLQFCFYIKKQSLNIFKEIKENNQKKGCGKYQNALVLKNNKQKGDKSPKTDIKIFLKKRKKKSSL